MRTVMANGCLQLHRAAPCDAVSTRSRPSESLIGTIRGLFNYIWADNKDPGQINERKAAGFHRRLVTPMDTSPTLPAVLWLPCDTLCWVQALRNVYAGCVSTDQSPSSSPGLEFVALPEEYQPQSVTPSQALENSTSLDLVNLFIHQGHVLLHVTSKE